MKPVDYEVKQADARMKCLVVAIVWCFLIAVILLVVFSIVHAAEPIDVNRLADAIYRAENSKAHPYGIMTKYKHTTPRQACINTIKSNYRRWVRAGRPNDFIDWLGDIYCPESAHPLNRNWKRNVKFFYKRLKICEK